MLRYFVSPRLLCYPQTMIFQQDGAPLRFANPVRQYLDVRLSHRWIEGDRPISWFAHSPDLTRCDFFMWGWVKAEVFGERPTTTAELKAEIFDALYNIDESLLQKVLKTSNLD